MLGNIATSLEIGDLPIMSGDMRAVFLYKKMKTSMRTMKPKVGNWRPKPGSGWGLIYRLIRVNGPMLTLEMVIAAVTAVLFYTPALFLQRLVFYLESDPERKDRSWGLFFCVGLFLSNAIMQLRESTRFGYFRCPIDMGSSYGPTLVHSYHFSASSFKNATKFDTLRENPCPKGYCFVCCHL